MLPIASLGGPKVVQSKCLRIIAGAPWDTKGELKSNKHVMICSSDPKNDVLDSNIGHFRLILHVPPLLTLTLEVLDQLTN